MLKKTLIATAAISATLLAAATVLPALAQSRSAALAGAAATSAQAPADAGVQDKRNAAGDNGADASPSKSEPGQVRRKAEASEHDDRHGDESHAGSREKDKRKEKHKSRD